MAWLSGWGKRIKVTVSNTNIDSDLTHFPLLLTLGTSVGTGNTDVSCIFDELQADANRKKIAVTKDDGETEIYVEIEKWDDANEKAWLWVSKSDLVLSSSGTTDLYIYYDIDHADNDTYVGDVGGRTEVWDSNYKGVWHMTGADYTEILDSTSNNNDAASTHGTPTFNTSAQIANGISGTGTDGVTVTDLDITGAITMESWVKLNDIDGNQAILGKQSGTTVNYIFGTFGGNEMSFYFYNGEWCLRETNTNPIAADTWYHVAATYTNGGDATIYVDGSTETSIWSMGSAKALVANDHLLTLLTTAQVNGINGIADEIRISDTARPTAWIKATYYAGDDNLVSWGSEETASVGTNFQINISDTWKSISAVKINIGNVWKVVTKAQVNISNVWKTIF